MKLATRGLGVLVALLVSLPLCASAQTVAAGQWHSVVLMPDGHVWTWGSNYYGQLGTDEASWVIHPSPVVVPNLDNVIAVAAGEVHTLALKNDGTVVAWGENGGGQIGDGTTDWRYHPVAVTGLSNIIAIAAKGYQSMALAADGTVYTWGLNWYGNLGDGTNVERHVPTVSTGLSGAVAIGQGYWASYAVKTDGTVWAAGGNIGQEFSNGGGPFWTPIQMGTVANVTAIAGGFDFSLALENDQTLWSAGSNISGQLGTGNPSGTSPAPLTTLSPVTAIATGYRHAMALVTDGTVWSWGQNDAGQLGDGTTINRGIPVAVSGLNNIAAIACGTLHCLAVGADGTVYTWGMNDHGQLGNGSIDTQFSGIFSPTAHAISGPGYVWKVPPPALSAATGTYTSDLTVSISSPVDGVELHYTLNGGDPTQADTAIANGGVITIDRTRTLKARGWKTGWTTSAISTRVYTMQVADVAIAPASGLYPAPLTVAMSTSTPSATIYYTTDGSTPTQTSAVYSGPLTVTTATTVKAYGARSGWNASNVSSAAYEISQGTLSTPVIAPASGSYTSSVTVSISAGAGAIHYTTDNSTPSEASPLYTAPFVLSASATVKARAFQGQYFPSDTAFASYEIVVADPAITPPGGTYAGTQTITVASATAGADVHYTLDGTDPTQASPTIAASGHLLIGAYTLKARAWKTGCTPSAIVSATFTTSGALTTPAIAAGYGISLALRSDGQLWDWGNNSYTELGDGTGTSRGTPALVPGLTGVRQIVSGAVHVMAVMSDSSLVVWGDNFDGRLGLGNYSPQSRPVAVPGLTNITSVDGGSQHTIVLLNDGTVVTMGLNNYGQLGDGTNTGRPTAAAVPGLTNITAVKAGPYSSLALRSDGTVWAWGFNQYGQLGEGTNGNRNTPTQVSGLSNVRTLDGGYLSSAAITTDGTLWTWGDNSYGQLGDAGPSRNVPGAVPGLTYVSQVAVGDYHVVALRSDGTVWTFGRNLEGQLGDGTTTGRATPMQVAGLTDIVQVAAGEYHSMALAADGTVYVWGRNYAGTIGDGTWWNNALVPVQIAALGLGGHAATPQIVPGSGLYNSAQSVSIASSSAGVTIHYTINGTDPTESSATYTSAITVTTDTTITARAFKAGWITSDLNQAALRIVYGTLATPVAAPGAGTYTDSQTVTLTADPAAAIRYTLDGSIPTPTSPLYSSPLAISNSTTLSARAFRSNWTASGTLVANYVIQRYTGPTITATVSPEPNAAGWHHTVPITVTFSCAAGTSPLVSCSDPQSFTSEGAGQAVTGTALDQAGQSRQLHVLANIDLTAPTVTIATPTAGTIVSTSSVVVTGSVSDALSGIAGVTCNGGLAVVSEGIFSCSVPVVTAGANTITVQAVDVAGIQASTTVTVTRDQTPGVSVETPVIVPTAALTVLSASSVDPGNGPLTYQWTQLSGPTVTLHGDQSAMLTFITPTEEATLMFRISVANATGSSSADVEVDAKGRATLMGIAPEAFGNSTLSVASTSLGTSYVWPAAATGLSITLQASDGATLDLASVNSPMTITLDNGRDAQDVTSWFTYDAPTNTLSLQSSQAPALREALSDYRSDFMILANDSLARSIDITVPIFLGRFAIQGSSTLPTAVQADALIGATVLLEGSGLEYRAVTTLASDGTFAFGNVPADDYSIVITGPSGIFGNTTLPLADNAPATQSVNVPLLTSPVSGGTLTTVFAEATAGLPQYQNVLKIPRGSHAVAIRVNIAAEGPFPTYAGWFDQSHPCTIDRLENPLLRGSVHDTPYSYAFLLNGQPVATGSGTYCRTVIHGLPSEAAVLIRTLEVSAAAADGDAELRLIATTDGTSGGAVTYASLLMKASLDSQFSIISVIDNPNQSGSEKKLAETVPNGFPKMVKTIGVPVSIKETYSSETYSNHWNMAITYQPADAVVRLVHVTAKSQNFGSEELYFTYDGDPEKGRIKLKDVGFRLGTTGHRQTIDPKDNDLVLEVKVEATVNGQFVSATANLGLDPVRHRNGLILTPLYEAGMIPGALRYNLGDDNHYANRGGDSWGTKRSNEIIKAHLPIMVFDDLSGEHGPVPGHHAHRTGTSIDIRYPGPGGDTNELNGRPEDSPTSGQRRTFLQRAFGAQGIPAERRIAVDWVRTVRANFDAIFAEADVKLIYIGGAAWQWNPIKLGTDEHGQAIKDPDTGVALGAWTPVNNGRLVAEEEHYTHAHVEVKQLTTGNPQP